MPRRRSPNPFTTVRSEGGLLPPELLQRVVDGDRSLPGLAPGDYHFGPSERLNERISRSWNRLVGLWTSFAPSLAKMEGDGEAGTGTTRERWLLPLFTELDFGRLQPAKADEIDGKSFPVSHRWGSQLPIHLVGAGVDLDHRSAGVAGAAKASPHGLVQELLNRTDALWGIVSNGKLLRLLRDNASLTRQAYLEFDLEAMMSGEVYADFALLFLLLHESRFEAERPAECVLERWVQAAQAQGTRVREQLRTGVEKAIETLGAGFLGQPANAPLRRKLRNGDLSTQDYYRQLLRLVYRLIFLFVAEDRNLLHPPDAPEEARTTYQSYYSSARLRNLAERRRGTRHPDLFEVIKLVTDALGRDDGAVALGLPFLGGFLFSTAACPDLDGSSLANVDLLGAVRALAFTVEDNALRPVDYRNLGSEELGSVYESLLELHPDIDAEAAAFSLTTAAGNERKTTGSYYTPTSLISALLDSALDPVVSEAMSEPDPEAALLELKVLDPACGSGHFLVAAAHRIARRLAGVRTGEDEPSPEPYRTALRDVISSCVYGIDLNPMAVELCKVSLWMEAVEPGKPLSFLDHHIVCGNSLLGTTPKLIAEGIPDEAFAALEGDDKKVVSELRKRNREERKGQQLFDLGGSPADLVRPVAQAVDALEHLPANSSEGVHEKERLWSEIEHSKELARAKLLSDAWCAAFVMPKEKGAPAVTDGILRLLTADPKAGGQALHDEIEGLAANYKFLHHHLSFPNVFRAPLPDEPPENPEAGWIGGFDVVIGNPPFLNQLETKTTRGRGETHLLQASFRGAARGYADVSVLFLLAASRLARTGGAIGLVQPQSVLAARDAMVARKQLAARGTPSWLWVAADKVFDANILVCAITVRIGLTQCVLQRSHGPSFQPLPPRRVEASLLEASDSWAPLIEEAFGGLAIELGSPPAAYGRLGDICDATADFRDQFYGLIPFVVEDAPETRDDRVFPRLITTGLIDPASLLWGLRPTKFGKRTWQAPRIDLARLLGESDLASWAQHRLVSKVLVATQTKVLEAIVDEEGSLLPSIPIISVIAEPAQLWQIAALLVSPPTSAWALREYGGVALSASAVKLSAKQLKRVPLPISAEPWLHAADLFKSATRETDTRAKRKLLIALGQAMCTAYGMPDGSELVRWWADRLPRSLVSAEGQ